MYLKDSKAPAHRNSMLLKCRQAESIWDLYVEDVAQGIPPEVTPLGEQVAEV